MRPMLKPSLARAWRDESTLQFGADPGRAVVVSGVTAPVRVVLDLLDGTRDVDSLVRAAAAHGVDPATATAVLDRLVAAGLVDDGAADASSLRAAAAGVREGLSREHAALSLLSAPPGAALRRLDDRGRARVVVTGRLPLASEIGALLRAAGVGKVTLLPDSRRLSAVDPARPPTFAVVVAAGVVGLDTVEAMHRAALPHLAVVVRELTGIVGPLVRPGATACLRCLDLHRTDRDPTWPLLAVQLAAGPRALACPAGLSAVVAGTAVLQTLAHLDDEPDAATLGGTLELALPDWRLRRRSWPRHPDCPCSSVAGGRVARQGA